MKMKFKEGFLEYKNGEYYRKNDNEPFEVDKRFAEEILLPSGVFEEDKEEKPKVKAEKSEGKEKK